MKSYIESLNIPKTINLFFHNLANYSIIMIVMNNQI